MYASDCKATGEIPRSGGAIVASNHLSIVDSIFLLFILGVINAQVSAVQGQEAPRGLPARSPTSGLWQRQLGWPRHAMIAQVSWDTTPVSAAYNAANEVCAEAFLAAWENRQAHDSAQDR